MNLIEILFKLRVEDIDLACDIATLVADSGFYIEDYSNLEQDALEIAKIDLIDEDLLKKDRTKAILHIYVQETENPRDITDFLEQSFAHNQIDYSLEFGLVKEEDWANNWKKHYKPTEIGERLLILPKWEQSPDTSRKKLIIDPGAAFGTGTHATTKACLEVIDRIIKGNEKILDVGTGSGILGIAALLLGAKSVLGVDIDQMAVDTAIDNGKMNGFEKPEFEVVCANLDECVDGKYDICFANIVADAIIELSSSVGGFINEGGLFVTSGIIAQRSEEVKEHLVKNTFEIVEEINDGKWACLISRI